jgi:predicted nucleic acid-binding protein
MGREREEAKRIRAAELIGDREFGTSAQVLQEFYTTVTGPGSGIPLSRENALNWIERLEIQPCASITASHVKISIGIAGRYRISYWDAAIIAAAEALGCSILYTEDLNHGQRYGEVTVINPFRDPSPHSAFHDNEQTRL